MKSPFLAIVMRMYVPQFFVSSQQRFGVMDIKALSACHSSQVLDRPCYSPQVSNGPVIALTQISVTAQCYSSILFRRQQENPSSRREGMLIQRHEEKSAPACRRERESWLWLLCLYIYLSLGLSYVNWASQECCLFYLRSSLLSSDLLLFYFHSFSLPCLLATTILKEM